MPGYVRLMVRTRECQTWSEDPRARLDELLDEHHAMLHHSLDGLTEAEARRLVPSRTTLLGLVKHVTD
jgi:hypothetical protein